MITETLACRHHLARFAEYPLGGSTSVSEGKMLVNWRTIVSGNFCDAYL